MEELIISEEERTAVRDLKRKIITDISNSRTRAELEQALSLGLVKTVKSGPQPRSIHEAVSSAMGQGSTVGDFEHTVPDTPILESDGTALDDL